MNEWNEGEFFDDLMLPGDDKQEKQAATDLFHRMEVRRMQPNPPRLSIAGRPPAQPYVFVEFPLTMYHRKLGEKLVYNTDEKETAVKEGWQFTPAKIVREVAILELIPKLEKEIADLIVEYEDITGLDWENEIEKIRRREAKKE